MDHHHQQELRRAAAQAFIQSLGQLEQNFQVEQSLEAETEKSPSSHSGQPVSPESDCASTQVPSQTDSFSLDIDALEAAAADIEEYIHSRTAPNVPPRPTHL